MISIITGDITNSRSVKDQDHWLVPLKELLSTYGRTPKAWEIYRGDSFQLEIVTPEDALLAAVCIKACIRSVKNLDVRMAIGIGDKTYAAPKITESNGTAFINSGETFESLKKQKRNLAIKTPWQELDEDLNFTFDLAGTIMDKWSVSSAELILLSLSNPELSQKELSEQLGISQSSVSERQKRSHYLIISEFIQFFHKKIQKQSH